MRRAVHARVIASEAMSELQNVQHMLDEAKRAVDGGDLASADALLREIARIQETELGLLHPELANTLNNLAIVAEMQGRFGDAEPYYRRAAAIASASLPSDDPMVASTRKNLEDFCRQRGFSIDPPDVAHAIEPHQPGPDEVAPAHPLRESKTDAQIDAARNEVEVVPPPPAGPSLADFTVTAPDLSPSPTTAKTRSLTIVAIALMALVAVALLVMRPWSTRESAAPTAPVPSPAAAPTPSEQPQSPSVASPVDQPGAASSRPGPAPSSGDMTLVTSQLCRTFSASNWRCDPAGQSVAPGPVVLYTRVRSSRDAIVIHRWYRGETLRKTARLPVQANPTDGYRTYSRQTVNSGENWRVEVRNTAGDLLYEQRVSVQ